ncbi:SURF1 family protein [Eoetvoesiella caeni]
MAKPHSTSRTLITLALLGVLAVACAMMGNWQLRRAAERDAIMQTIEAGRKAAPLKLDAATPDGELVQWRQAATHGVWLHDFTVLLDNRNFKGKPGFWVATPLLIDPATRTAVLVLRGWLPRPILPGESLPPLPRPEGMQQVQGQIVSHVPRMFELWSLSGKAASALPKLPLPDKTPPRVQNLPLQDLASATGLKLLPAVLEQTGGAGSAGGAEPFVQEWPQPSTDSDQNRGYALQWFGFACIAAVAALVVAWRALRRRTQPAR